MTTSPKPEYSISQSQTSTYLLTTLTLPHTAQSAILPLLTNPRTYFPLNPCFTANGHNPVPVAGDVDEKTSTMLQEMGVDDGRWGTEEVVEAELMGVRYNIATRAVVGLIVKEVEAPHGWVKRVGIETEWECEVAVVGSTSMRSVIFVEEVLEGVEDVGGLRKVGCRVEEKFEVLKAPWGMTGTVLKRSAKERVTAFENMVVLLGKSCDGERL